MLNFFENPNFTYSFKLLIQNFLMIFFKVIKVMHWNNNAFISNIKK